MIPFVSDSGFIIDHKKDGTYLYTAFINVKRRFKLFGEIPLWFNTTDMYTLVKNGKGSQNDPDSFIAVKQNSMFERGYKFEYRSDAEHVLQHYIPKFSRKLRKEYGNKVVKTTYEKWP